MILSTLVVYGRYWYDFLTIAWVVGFFLIECLLLFRSSVIGWAMTAKCLMLAGIFSWTLINPPPLRPESVALDAVVIRSLLIGVLGYVIAVLLWMRWQRETVVVGRVGDEESTISPRYFPLSDFMRGRRTSDD
jgi:hypothetical protein